MNRVSAIIGQLERVGFRIARQTSSLVFLVHPDHPGLLIRVGTVYLVAERAGQEIARQRLDSFRIEDVMSVLRSSQRGAVP